MISDFTFRLIEIIGIGQVRILRPVLGVLTLFVALDIAWLGIEIVLGRMRNAGAIVMHLFTQLILIWIITNYVELAQVFNATLVRMADAVGAYYEGVTLDPSRHLRTVHEKILVPIERAFGRFKAWNPLSIKRYVLTYLPAMLAFVILSVQLVIAMIQFHLVVLVATPLLPFLVFKPVRFIGAKIFSAVIGQAINLMAIVALSGVMVDTFVWTVGDLQNHTPGMWNRLFATGGWTINFLAIAALMCFLALQITAVSSTILSGIPNLGGGSFAQSMTALAAAGFAATKVVTGLVRAEGGAPSDRAPGGSGGLLRQALSGGSPPAQGGSGMSPPAAGGSPGATGGPERTGDPAADASADPARSVRDATRAGESASKEAKS